MRLVSGACVLEEWTTPWEFWLKIVVKWVEILLKIVVKWVELLLKIVV